MALGHDIYIFQNGVDDILKHILGFSSHKYYISFDILKYLRPTTSSIYIINTSNNGLI